MLNDPPYKRSRAADREKFGSRSIDASAPNVSQGGTVGNAAWKTNGGLTNSTAWNSFFGGADRQAAGENRFKPKYSTGTAATPMPNAAFDSAIGKMQGFNFFGSNPAPAPAAPSLTPTVQPDLTAAASLFKPRFASANPIAKTSSTYLMRLGIDPDVSRRISLLED